MMNKQKILLCEDNALVAQITTFALQGEGFEVKTAVTTDAALQLCRAEHYDLVLLDLNLPGGGGTVILQELKKNAATAQIPVVLFSGEDDLDKKAAELKADGFIQKPFEVPGLIATIKGLLPQPSVK